MHVWRRASIGVVAAMLMLAACSSGGGSDPARGQASDSNPGTSEPPRLGATSTTIEQTPLVEHKVGDSIALGDIELTVLAVQDPFPTTAQTQPQPGDRLVSVKYEVINHSPVAQMLSDLPAVQLQDSTGASYTSEHSRLSLIAGSRVPGELLPTKRMESSVVYEVPADAGGLRALVSGPATAGKPMAMVILG